jgi:hypothetical protein
MLFLRVDLCLSPGVDAKYDPTLNGYLKKAGVYLWHCDSGKFTHSSHSRTRDNQAVSLAEKCKIITTYLSSLLTVTEQESSTPVRWKKSLDN